MIYVVELLDELDSQVSSVIGAAWSKNTLSSKNSQWSRYINFCHGLGLEPVPAAPNTVARFLVWQAKGSKYSTCNNDLSAITVLHWISGSRFWSNLC